MDDFLRRMAEASRHRANQLIHEGEASLLRRAHESPPPRPLALKGFDLIAEVKFRAPSVSGELQPGSMQAVEQRAKLYADAGACAISVLTEPSRFGGSLDHLTAASKAVEVGVMRKDFLVHCHQIIEARAAGASGVLLITALFSDDGLTEAIALAQELSLFVLLEAFSEKDVARMARLAPRSVLYGVNCRNLRTLQVDPNRHARLANRLPADVISVAESGLYSKKDAIRVATQGYAVALVGTALMRAVDPGSAVRDLIAAGRGVREASCS